VAAVIVGGWRLLRCGPFNIEIGGGNRSKRGKSLVVQLKIGAKRRRRTRT
jgi:hypothetical protein